MEDYLKAIYHLEQEHGNASTSMLADYMGISAASVTGMIKKLATLEMVQYEPYRGVKLTASGRGAALETLRHHRILELFLTEKLGFGWDEVHTEADRLEHHISEALEARLFDLLGQPTHDPHGDPIPTLSGDLPALELHALTEVRPGARGVVARVLTQEDDTLRYLREIGLSLDAMVEVLSVEQAGGTITLRIDDKRDVTISAEIGERVQMVHAAEE
jgi:DtxR family Mn-dependent transcriptional regulator